MSASQPAPKRKAVATRTRQKEILRKRMREMGREERLRYIGRGGVRIKGGQLRISNATRLRADNVMVLGDNNFVEGNGNVIIGQNNQGRGTDNEFRTQLERPPPPDPVPEVSSVFASAIQRVMRHPQPGRATRRQSRSRQSRLPARPPSAPQTRTENSVGSDESLLTESSTFDEQEEQQQQQQQQETSDDKVRAALMPMAGTDPRQCVWKVSAFDLPGEPTEAPDDPDKECVVCRTNARDTLFEPCHHLVCCRACTKELAKQKDDLSVQCPLKCGKVQYMSIIY